MNGPLAALLMREIRLATRIGGGTLIGVLFFLTVVTVFPFAVGPDMNLLAKIGPGVLWVGALLATLLGLDDLFQADRDDGSLDLLIIAGYPMELIVLIKCAAHWITKCLPLVAAVPVLAIFVNLEPMAIGAVFITVLVGTPALTMIGAIGAALSISLRRGGVLMAILILPITVPVLIFGVISAEAAVTDPQPFMPPFMILCALSLFSLVVGAFAAAATLRFAMD